MLEHILKGLLRELELSFDEYLKQVDENDFFYIEDDEDYQYNIESVANFIKSNKDKL